MATTGPAEQDTLNRSELNKILDYLHYFTMSHLLSPLPLSSSFFCFCQMDNLATYSCSHLFVYVNCTRVLARVRGGCGAPLGSSAPSTVIPNFPDCHCCGDSKLISYQSPPSVPGPQRFACLACWHAAHLALKHLWRVSCTSGRGVKGRNKVSPSEILEVKTR